MMKAKRYIALVVTAGVLLGGAGYFAARDTNAFRPEQKVVRKAEEEEEPVPRMQEEAGLPDLATAPPAQRQKTVTPTAPRPQDPGEAVLDEIRRIGAGGGR